MATDKSTSDLPPEKEYERLNPGGGPPGQQEERGKPNPKVTRDDGGAGIPGSQNEDLKGPKPGRGPKGANRASMVLAPLKPMSALLAPIISGTLACLPAL